MIVVVTVMGIIVATTACIEIIVIGSGIVGIRMTVISIMLLIRNDTNDRRH